MTGYGSAPVTAPRPGHLTSVLNQLAGIWNAMNAGPVG